MLALVPWGVRCATNWSENYPVSAEGVQFRVESALLIPSEPGVEVLGFLVVTLVDAHLAGVYSCVGFTGAVVGIDVPGERVLTSTRVPLKHEGASSAVSMSLATMSGMMSWSTLSIPFRGPGFLKSGEAVGDPREESFAGAGLAVAATHVRFACSR